MFEKLRKKLNKKGFTLVELIVVIAILGILATIAVPRLSGFREQAQAAATAATTKTLDNAAKMYIATNGIPAANITWDESTNTDQWDDYLDEWPTNYEVTIEDDGDITVTAP